MGWQLVIFWGEVTTPVEQAMLYTKMFAYVCSIWNCRHKLSTRGANPEIQDGVKMTAINFKYTWNSMFSCEFFIYVCSNKYLHGYCPFDKVHQIDILHRRLWGQGQGHFKVKIPKIPKKCYIQGVPKKRGPTLNPYYWFIFWWIKLTFSECVYKGRSF